MGSADYATILKSKYDNLINRSFETKLEMWLFNHFTGNRKSDTLDVHNFRSFSITSRLVKLYEGAWQIREGVFSGVDVNKLDKIIINWLKDNEVQKKELNREYKSNFHSVLSLDSFAEVYPKEKEMRKCSYCGVSEEEIDLIRSKGQINTKVSRGKHHEIDRLNSNMEYTKNNIVLACYWCNNAKTDEFTYDEFKEIVGPAIGKVWSKRIKA